MLCHWLLLAQCSHLSGGIIFWNSCSFSLSLSSNINLPNYLPLFAIFCILHGRIFLKILGITTKIQSPPIYASPPLKSKNHTFIWECICGIFLKILRISSIYISNIGCIRLWMTISASMKTHDIFQVFTSKCMSLSWSTTGWYICGYPVNLYLQSVVLVFSDFRGDLVGVDDTFTTTIL